MADREANKMKHIKVVSSERPAKAQFEPILQFIGIFQAMFGLPGIIFGGGQAAITLIGGALGLLGTSMGLMMTAMNVLRQLHETFGTPIPNKGEG